MHIKNVRDDHRPSFWMVVSSAPFSLSAMAPDAFECVACKEQACFCCTTTEHRRDVTVNNVVRVPKLGARDKTHGCCKILRVQDNRMHPSCQGFDRTEGG